MRTMRHFTALALLLSATLLVPLSPLAVSTYAQGPTPGDPLGLTNNTSMPESSLVDGQFYHVAADVTSDPFVDFKFLETRQRVEFELQDMSDPNHRTRTLMVGPQVQCTLEPVGETGNWLANFDVPCSTFVPWGSTSTASVQVIRTVANGPFSATWRVNVTMVRPQEELITSFLITSRLEEFPNLSLSAGATDPARPDSQFDIPLRLNNMGNALGIFRGEVSQPEGWTVLAPESVAVPAGEAVMVNVTVIAPREKGLYLYESALAQVTYTDVNNPAMSRTMNLPLTVNGVYLHPALTPLLVLAVLLVVIFVYFAILARRAVEESILGKPVPPWRIPAEKAHLAKLEKTDPDEFYIVRYYLMVEEHQSALLWFKHFKKATKKDRKAEAKWFSIKRKQERRIAKRERLHARVGNKWDRKITVVVKKRDRKTRRLEKRLRRRERKAHRKRVKKHDKIVAKIEKKHDKKVNRALKKHEKLVAKGIKKVEKENKKRAKRDEDALPLPEMPEPEFEDPVLPTVNDLEEQPLAESRYGKRVERLHARAARKTERLEARKHKLVAKDRSKADLAGEKLRAKIPPEPETHLYDIDEYVPEDEVVVEDDRHVLKRLLHMPTLEEREEERRRRNVYAARIKQTKSDGDEEAVDAVRRRFKEERAARLGARKAAVSAVSETAKEDKLLSRERKRRVKDRQKEIVREAVEEAKAPHEPSADVPGSKRARDSVSPSVESNERSGFAGRFKIKRVDAEEAVSEPQSPKRRDSETKGGKTGGRMKARFRRTSEGDEPESEPDAEPATASRERT